MALEIRPQPPQSPVRLGWETSFGSPDRCTCAKAGVPKSSAAEPIKENAAKANVQAHRPAITRLAPSPECFGANFSRDSGKIRFGLPASKAMPVILMTPEPRQP